MDPLEVVKVFSAAWAEHDLDAALALVTDDFCVRALEADIKDWIEHWNDNPRPYVWVKTADQILASIARYCERVSAIVAAGK